MRTGTLQTGDGSTLAELLVVLAIIAVLMGVSYPFYSTLGPRIQLASATRELLTDLRAVRRDALRERETRELHFRRSGSAYEWNGHVRRLPPDVAVSLDQASGDALVRFYKDGSGDPAVITLSRGPRREVIRIDWLTGRAGLDGG